MNYSDVLNRYRDDPREIPTDPKKEENAKWFRVYVRNDALYIASGREHPNACSVSPDRRLNPSKFDQMLDIYRRRQRGEAGFQEARDASMNASYWFGIFKDMQL